MPCHGVWANSLVVHPVLQLGTWCAIVSMMSFAGLFMPTGSRTKQRCWPMRWLRRNWCWNGRSISHNWMGWQRRRQHELGTPLATISVVAKEMERELSGDERFREDVALLRSQSERCRDILRRLTSLSADNEEHMRRPALLLLDRGGDSAAAAVRNRACPCRKRRSRREPSETAMRAFSTGWEISWKMLWILRKAKSSSQRITMLMS